MASAWAGDCPWRAFIERWVTGLPGMIGVIIGVRIQGIQNKENSRRCPIGMVMDDCVGESCVMCGQGKGREDGEGVHSCGATKTARDNLSKSTEPAPVMVRAKFDECTTVYQSVVF